MKALVMLVLASSVAFAQNKVDAAHAHSARQTTAVMPVPKVFASALSQVKAKSRVAVLLPSKLPAAFARVKYATIQAASPNEYAIDLYYELGIGDAGFAAFFSGEAHPDDGLADLGDVTKVKLADGLSGYFRSVSCGGSCAPANLWWMQSGTLYQIQLVLSPALPESDQEKEIVETANSAIIAGAR
ncbi:MAG TPA: hypothetical protein VFU55_05050 [Terracidiphilus sp.]|nr:hypothetical protein [Terracidiphilus sp.]